MRRWSRRAAVGALAASVALPFTATIGDGAEIARDKITPEARAKAEPSGYVGEIVERSGTSGLTGATYDLGVGHVTLF